MFSQIFNKIRQMYVSLQWKLLLPFLVIVLVVIIFLLPYSTNVVVSQVGAEADRQLLAVAESVGALMEDKEGQAVVSAQLVANLPEMAVLADEPARLALLEAQKTQLGLQELSFYGADYVSGDLAVFYGGSPLLPQEAISSHTQQVRADLLQGVVGGGNPAGDIAISPHSSQIIGVAPVYNGMGADATLQGIILAAFYMDDAFIADISTILGTDVGIVSNKTVIVSNIDEASGYTQLLQSEAITPAMPAQTITYENDAPYRLLANPLMFRGSMQGSVIVAQPLEDLAEIGQDLQTLLIAFAGGVVVITLILSGLVLIGFTRPVRHLTTATNQISNGHLEQRVNIPYILFQDEITELSMNFNKMATDLQAIYEELEQRVQSRTAELVAERNKLNDTLAELAIARDKAVEANNAKSEFVSLLSHELKAPMTNIQGYNQLLETELVGELNEQQRDFVQRIATNVCRMSTLVSDLADVSRIETGHLHLNFEGIDLRGLVADVLASSQPQIAAKEHQVTVKLPNNLPLVKADRNRLVQVMTNLVNNAIKYTPAGGEIIIEASEDLMGNVIVCVKDKGIGIHPKDQANLFQKFFRADDEAVRQVSGTGLGLVITKNLIEAQGGKLWFESVYREGSAFYFSLPAGNSSA